MTNFKPNTCETCALLHNSIQPCFKCIHSGFKINDTGRTDIWQPVGLFVEVERLTAELAEHKGDGKHDHNFVYTAERESLRKENEKLRAYCYKYGVCTQCGYMCSADGEFHVCKEGAVSPAAPDTFLPAKERETMGRCEKCANAWRANALQPKAAPIYAPLEDVLWKPEKPTTAAPKGDEKP